MGHEALRGAQPRDIEPDCNRYALLALADEIETDGVGNLDIGCYFKPQLEEYAHRIREACGVSE